MKKLQLIQEGQEPITVEVRDDVQEAAFLREGFVPVEEKPKKK